uniref:Uncharacterized protein n=1 Tax=Trichogramma kaykai TaxID=54128 RepID=A0ABD2WI07_9HYME
MDQNNSTSDVENQVLIENLNEIEEVEKNRKIIFNEDFDSDANCDDSSIASDSDDDSDVIFGDYVQDDRIMFPASNLSVADVIIMVNAIVIKFNPTKKFQESLIEFIKILAGKEFESWRFNTYRAKKQFAPTPGSIKKNFYCLTCNEILLSTDSMKPVHKNVTCPTLWDLPPDYMHGALLGVSKQLLNKWTSCYFNKDHLKKIESRMLNIKLCRDVRRSIRTLDYSGKYKATEWRTWLLFISLPVVKGILPDKEFISYCRLVDSIYVLLKESITDQELNRVEYNLLQFVGESEEIYLPPFITFNVHSLNHYCHAVRNSGPLWTTSAFPFENGIFQFMKEVNSPNGCLLQISEKWIRKSNFQSFLSHQKSDDDRTIEYCKSLFCDRPPLKNCTVVDNITFTDATNTTVKIIDSVSRILNKKPSFIQVFHRCIYKSTLFHGINYKRCLKTQDTIVKTLDDKIYEIHYFIRIDKQSFIYGRQWEIENNDFGLGIDRFPIVRHIFKLRKKLRVNCLVEISNIGQKMLVIDTNDDVYLTSLPNNYEVQ